MSVEKNEFQYQGAVLEPVHAMKALDLTLILSYWDLLYMGISFWTSLNNPLFRNIPHGGFFRQFVICCICVFVCLCISVFVFLYLRFWHMGISFLTSLNNPLFKNIPHGGSFWHFVICCICVFVCLCICVFVFGLGRSLLDQFGQKNASPLSSTFWFESSKPSYLFKSVLLLQPYSIEWVA